MPLEGTNNLYSMSEVVPRPAIQMSALPYTLLADQCNITVNCSIWEDWVLSVCNESFCQTFGQSLRTVNITISAGHRSVFCSGTNHVSTSNVSEKICEYDALVDVGVSWCGSERFHSDYFSGFIDLPIKETQPLLYTGLLGLPLAILLGIAIKCSHQCIKHQVS